MTTGEMSRFAAVKTGEIPFVGMTEQHGAFSCVGGGSRAGVLAMTHAFSTDDRTHINEREPRSDTEQNGDGGPFLAAHLV
jgi:hypothetical protein